MFNKYFTEVGAKLSNQIVNASSTFLDYLMPVNCEFHFAVINNDTILKKISKIKPNKALGLDNISGKLLKDTATVVAKYREYRLYINPEVEMSVAITDQYLFCLQYLRFSKRLFSIKLMNILPQMQY